jgi:hypothetical protein
VPSVHDDSMTFLLFGTFLILVSVVVLFTPKIPTDNS